MTTAERGDLLAPRAGEWSWFTIWARSFRAAYKLAYGERMAALRGKRTKSYDDRGLHPYSEQWGRITLSESFVLSETGWAPPDASPTAIKNMAQHDAYSDFISELRKEEDED